ncbi:YlzJ-like family protein [Desulfallas sp. Bu1-1]|uniref:YlzJ-like family protein n=1 Tax=Desulfallas sp. Bu1-1 TaxID=2787620 RepID=UPI00189CFF42|nr:YlzJ-like family protein [Desulfallas sp. Bu1-1]MBF7083035.1 YlzJ-like family protein [Desulfallas sp. Bu1-1]
MILYTPMQLELVLAGLDQVTRSGEEETTVDGIPAIVRRTADGKEQIVQLLSTNPADYLRKDLCPGALVRSDRK